MDDWISEQLAERGICAARRREAEHRNARQCHRSLNIMALRLYHYEEQLERDDVSEEHVQKMHVRIGLCRAQIERLEPIAARIAR